MRGKVAADLVTVYFDRITPAYAGKSRKAACFLPLPWDHPRLCGEKKKCSVETMHLKGSPPPMRGKGSTLGAARERRRITPAYAGKSTWKYMPFVTLQDHPRLCGEKFNCFPKFRRRLGSPPPMRGKGKSFWRDN